MKLAILETGRPPEDIVDRFGDYPSMFRTLLGEGAHDYTTYDVAEGQFPAEVEDHRAYIITGSSAGVYEPHPWIDPLKGFLQAARGRTALVGVCFGHQIMAEAFGGKVIKSPKGWGVGLHRYEVATRHVWMDKAATIGVPASHQDQVVELPLAPRLWPPMTSRPSACWPMRTSGPYRSSCTRSSPRTTPGR